MFNFDAIATQYLAPAMQAAAGEDVIFKPKGGTEVPGTAIIERSMLEPVAAIGGQASAYVIKAQIPKSLAATLNFNGDKLAIKKRKSDAATTDMTISTLLGEDGAMWHVALSS